MRQFSKSGFRLWNLSVEAKIIYSFFCLMSLLALGSSLLLYEDLVGPTLRPGRVARVALYYAGEVQGQRPAPGGEIADRQMGPLGQTGPPRQPGPSDQGGPEIALPDEAKAPALVFAVPYRKLLEVTHFHLFTVPVFLLIISHLFMLTGASSRSKIGWIVAGWLSSLLHLAAPWLIRSRSGLSWLYPATGASLLLSCLVLTVYPAVVMWRRQDRTK